ncbi:MAG TPA: cytochrome c [Gemmatimonadaceae bacterium]|nr:cytochrome c [Gemmatimonadaceae bacterium]
MKGCRTQFVVVRLALIAALALAGGRTAGAQATRPARKASSKTAHAAAKPVGPSTLDGVYTDEQASRGKDVYAGSCRSCHSPMSHTGATFNKWWRGKPLSDLFTFVSTRMPKNDPGSMAPEDVADVIAYLLKMNAMPVGPAELPPDADSLKKFRIEAKPKAGSTTKRANP